MNHGNVPLDPDPALSRLVRDLETVYAVTPPAQLGTTIDRLAREHRLAPAARARVTDPLGVPRRLSSLVAVCLTLLLVAGGVIAVSPFSNRAFGLDAGVKRVMDDGLGTAVNQTQTVDGYTVTIGSVYADGNRLIVGYRITVGADDEALDAWLDQPIATTADGEPLPRHGSLGAQVVDGSADSVVWFDTSSLSTIGDRLRVRLDVSALLVAEFDAGVLGEIVPRSLITRVTDDWVTLRQVPLSMHFDLDTPVHQTRTIAIGEPVTANGRVVTLDRVSIAPSATIVWLHGVDDVGNVTLVVPGSEAAEVRVVDVWRADDGSFAMMFNDQLHDRLGRWSLIVEPLKITDGEDVVVDQGDEPWSWTFEVR